MSDIYSLLNINKGIFQDFPLLADRVADHQTEKMVKKNTSKLKQIEERMFVDKGLDIAQKSIDEIISKVIRLAPYGDTSSTNWTIRELRIVSYYLMKLRDNSENYLYALNLLDNNWKNMFFNGLAFYLMNSWHSIEPEYRERTSQLLVKKLREYSEHNRRYLLWKNYVNLFDSNGPIRMAAMITAKKMSIADAPSLLGFKNTTIKQSYYSDVIIKYVANNHLTSRDEIEQIFELHDIDRTKKLVFAYLVEQEDRIGDGLRRAQLCRFANAKLGDVTLAASWAPFIGATAEDAQKLKHAMQMVNMWFAQQIIESFFEICVQDKERKDFWLKYVQYISGFKIIGSTAIKLLLQSNSNIGSMFLRHFIETNSYSSQTSALALFIKNKMIVEFSDTGALYVYNQTHRMVRTVTNARYGIASTNDLKIPSTNLLIEPTTWGTYYYYEEGRITHRGAWQERLSGWMRRMVLSPENTNLSLFDTKNDDVFKEQALPKEDFKVQPAPEEKTTENRFQKTTNANTSDNTASVQYESGVTYRISSKLLENNIRVVAATKGIYISIDNKKFVLVRAFPPGEYAAGNIWIKNSSHEGWREIVHNYQGSSTRSVGYIRISSTDVTYKESLSVAGKTKIKI
jgi:hypothetical protein